jgi:hypothetical protein
VGQIDIGYKGQRTRIAGDRVVDATWTTTFRVPNNARQIYKSMDDWSRKAAPKDGVVVDPASYKTNMKVEAIGNNGAVAQTWNLIGVWVQTLPSASFDSETSDTIQEWPVTFSIDEIEVA